MLKKIKSKFEENIGKIIHTLPHLVKIKQLILNGE